MQYLRRPRKTRERARFSPLCSRPHRSLSRTATENAASKAHEEKALKDDEAKLKKSEEFDDIEKKIEDTNLKGNQTKVTQFLKLEKAEEALAAAKIKVAVKKTEEGIVVATRKKAKEALAAAKLDEE